MNLKIWKDNGKKLLTSVYMVFPIFLLKILVYYSLIDVDMGRNFWVLGSVPLFGLLFFGLADSKLKRRRMLFLGFYSLFSILMFADSMYFNYYNQTVSVKQLWQAANVAAVPSSFIATLIPASFVLILDIPVIYLYFRKRVRESKAMRKLTPEQAKGAWALWNRCRRPAAGIAVALVLILAVNPLQTTFFQKINSVGFFTNHISDIYHAAVDSMPVEAVAEEKVLENVDELTEEIEQPDLAGVAKGKNLILIQVEALQDMVIGQEYNGQELTPNLNALLNRDTLYFDNYYTNIGKGNTADAEFSTLNSLYPVIDRESYQLFQTNTYNGLPWLLREQGYEAFAVHGYYEDFWNRKAAYPYQGFEEFYSLEDFQSDDVIGLGLSDKSMFGQTIDILKEQDQPYFAFIITLTNHHPYILDEERSEISLLPEHEGTKFGAYLQTVHYTDEAIGDFIRELKEQGLYDDTVIALYGDHHGLNVGMDDNKTYVSEYLEREYDYDEMLHIPMMIHIPGLGHSETISTLGGQIDFLPTIANLMGISIDQPYILGRDLYNAKEGFVAFTAYLFEGSFAKNDIMFQISREGIFEGSRAWEIGTGRQVDIKPYYDDYERALAIKKTSEEILTGDLISSYVTHNIEPSEESE